MIPRLSKITEATKPSTNIDKQELYAIVSP